LKKIRLSLATIIFLGTLGGLCANSPKALNEAKEYLKKHSKDFPNQNYLAIIDYSKGSHEKRFYLVDLKNNSTQEFLVAHGKGSDPKHTGKAVHFGDSEGSRMTSLGYFKTAETYVGQHGYSLKLLGLSDSNKNALSRLIVIHGANYVDPKRKVLGRSWGCPALEPQFAKEVIDKIKNGALVYSHI
jgi:hypothetical protein